ncbi:MAG: FeoA domain-containing protein [Dokdonella sp.]
MRLSELAQGVAAVVHEVVDVVANDPIARRLRDFGFVRGESVRIVASGPIGGDPLLVQVGFTRFALRRAEAARIQVMVPATA